MVMRQGISSTTARLTTLWYFMTSLIKKSAANLSSSSAGEISGYASVYNTPDHDNDIVMPGAFASSLKSSRRVKLLWNHDHNQVIGKITQLKEDDYGLWFSAQLNLAISKGNEVYQLVKAGDVNQLSIGFTITKSRPSNSATQRLLEQLDLWEISVVTFPANEKAQINEIKSFAPLLDYQTLYDTLKEARLVLNKK